MITVDDLLAFLRAQLDEDERVARAATVGPWEWGPSPTAKLTWGLSGSDVPFGGWILRVNDAGCPSTHDAQHIARWDPARVLAEVEAKRRILDAWQMQVDDDDPHAYLAGDVLPKLLVQPYAGRDGWREEWAS